MLNCFVFYKSRHWIGNGAYSHFILTLLSFCCSSFESVVASQLVRLLDLLRFTSSLPGFSIFRQFFFCFPPSFLPFFFSKALYYVSSSSSPSVSCVLTDLIPRPCFWLADIKDSEIVGKVRGGHRSRICPARQQIQIAAENKLKPRPEIACCCHRGQFVSTQDLKYEGGGGGFPVERERISPAFYLLCPIAHRRPWERESLDSR